MKLNNKYIVFFIILMNTVSCSANKYIYKDIGECYIPIDTKMESIMLSDTLTRFIEKDFNYSNMHKSPKVIDIIVKKGTTEESIKNTISKYKFIYKRTKNGYIIYSKDRKEDNSFYIVMNDNILSTNYSKDEIDYLLDYCNKHPK